MGGVSFYPRAVVVKLVYTLVSGTSGRKVVKVRVLSTAPSPLNLNPNRSNVCLTRALA